MRQFYPSSRLEKRENLTAALGAAVITPAFLAFARDERNAVVLLSFSVAAALATYGIYALRGRFQKVHRIEFSPEALIVEDRRGRHMLPWGDVTGVNHSYVGGEHWVLKLRTGKTFVLRAEGLSVEEAGQISELVQHYASIQTAD